MNFEPRMFCGFSVKAWAKKRKCFDAEPHSACKIVRINIKRSFTCDLCNVLHVGETTGYRHDCFSIKAAVLVEII